MDSIYITSDGTSVTLNLCGNGYIGTVEDLRKMISWIPGETPIKTNMMLGDAYSPEQIMEKLNIKKDTCYKLISDAENGKHDFGVVRFGSLIRIPKGGFELWWNGKQNKNFI